MFKKIICLIAALLLMFSFVVSAEDEFLVYGEDDIERLCEILDLNDCDIKYYCEQNNITYFAVNSDNTKQIKRSEVSDDFSKKIIDFTVLEDSEILELSEELSTFADAKGEIVQTEGYKLLKTEVKTKDSGGEYVLTQYVTVKDAKKIVLSFYTDANSDREYIQKVLEEHFKPDTNFKPFIIIGVVVFAGLALLVLVLIIKELRKKES